MNSDNSHLGLLDSPLQKLLATELKVGDRCVPSQVGIQAGQFTCKRCDSLKPWKGVVVWVSKDKRFIKVQPDGKLTPKRYWCGFWESEKVLESDRPGADSVKGGNSKV